MAIEQGTNGWEGLIATPVRRSNGNGVRSARVSARRPLSAVPRSAAPVRRPDSVHRAAPRIIVLAAPGLFADGLARSLRMLGSGVEVRIASVRDNLDSLARCALIIVDLDGAGDVESMLATLRGRTQAPIVALAHSPEAARLEIAMRAGAVALLSTSCTESQLLEQVSTLLHGGQSTAAAPDARQPELAGRTAADRSGRPYGMTPGEMDVLRLLREGLTNAQIARERGSKEGTVKIHLDKIYKKLGVQNRTQAICIASRMDSLIDLQAKRLEDAEFRFEALSAYVTHEIHREGEVLFSHGDQGDFLYYVQRGRVRLVELGLTMQDGDLFGEIGIFSPGHARTCTARCETQVSLFRLSAEKAHRLYLENPRFAYQVLRLIAGRLLADRARMPVDTTGSDR
ncbi:MAG: cyclic nucleotide-binding domain-containing protein [Burkholderiales bacterium]|nr:cyclic nucleotide-binding domain-containing protein [Burkholderiales bacterium]